MFSRSRKEQGNKTIVYPLFFFPRLCSLKWLWMWGAFLNEPAVRDLEEYPQLHSGSKSLNNSVLWVQWKKIKGMPCCDASQRGCILILFIYIESMHISQRIIHHLHRLIILREYGGEKKDIMLSVHWTRRSVPIKKIRIDISHNY